MDKKYRPSSPVLLLCGNLDQIAKWQLCSNFVNNRLFTSVQQGFIKNKLCPKNVLLLLYDTRRMDEDNTVEFCYFDFREAFNSLCYFLIGRQLSVWVGSARKWMGEFFCNLNFTFWVCNYEAESKDVPNETPQWSAPETPVSYLFYWLTAGTGWPMLHLSRWYQGGRRGYIPGFRSQRSRFGLLVSTTKCWQMSTAGHLCRSGQRWTAACGRSRFSGLSSRLNFSPFGNVERQSTRPEQ